jgi:hypothetical protein
MAKFRLATDILAKSDLVTPEFCFKGSNEGAFVGISQIHALPIDWAGGLLLGARSNRTAAVVGAGGTELPLQLSQQFLIQLGIEAFEQAALRHR